MQQTPSHTPGGLRITSSRYRTVLHSPWLKLLNLLISHPSSDLCIGSRFNERIEYKLSSFCSLSSWFTSSCAYHLISHHLRSHHLSVTLSAFHSRLKTHHLCHKSFPPVHSLLRALAFESIKLFCRIVSYDVVTTWNVSLDVSLLYSICAPNDNENCGRSDRRLTRPASASAACQALAAGRLYTHQHRVTLETMNVNDACCCVAVLRWRESYRLSETATVTMIGLRPMTQDLVD